ncbi:recombinase RecT [Streptomyces luteireticuli]|uniref:recombinase RecT n=1 Tax=Streptomyces luteireticuli TaxID=173858 RepID=UPI0035579B9E
MTEAASELAIGEDQTGFTDEQVRVLQIMYPHLQTVTSAQMKVFFHQCQLTQLDPFAQQIYMIRRREKGETRWTVQTGIAGYRLTARRAVTRAGEDLTYEDPVWYDVDGREHAVWLKEEPPAACRVVVWRGASRYPGVAHWREYAPFVYSYELDRLELDPMWARMPANQIRKVAEAAALRMACPADLSGIRIAEEMQSQDRREERERVDEAAGALRREQESHSAEQPTEASATQGDAPPDPAAELDEARRRVRALAEQKGVSFADVTDACVKRFNVAFQDADVPQLVCLEEDLTSGSTVSAEEAREAAPESTAPSRKQAAPRTAARGGRTAAKSGTRKRTAAKRTPRKPPATQADSSSDPRE